MARLSARTYALAIIAYFALASGAVFAVEDIDGSVRRILVVYQDASTVPAAIEIARGLNKGLLDRATMEFEVYSEFLDIVRFPAPDHVRRLADNMVAKYETVPIDVLVAVGPGALRFMLDHSSRFASGVPLVFGDVSERTLERLSPPEDAMGVVSPFDVSKTIDLARRLQPDATRIVVVTGSAEFDRYWQESAHQKLGERYQDLEVDYLSGLTLDGFIA